MAYKQLSLFSSDTLEQLKQKQVDQWELFLQTTKAATFDENAPLQKVPKKKKPRKKQSDG